MADVPESVRQWSKKAEGDLRSARLLRAADPPISDAVAFHAQHKAPLNPHRLMNPSRRIPQAYCLVQG